MQYFFVVFSLLVSGLFSGEINSLTKAEEKAGWQLLFEGKDLNNHWRNIGQKEVTGKGWVIEKGVIKMLYTDNK